MGTRCDHAAPTAYERRDPAAQPAYRVVLDHLDAFLAQRDLPSFVERALRDFLRCGILAHGFARVRCPDCRHERPVPFSCKRASICPSCGGRRMADQAAHLVDDVLPDVPVRQWVLTLPMWLRYRCAYDAALRSRILDAFIRGLFADQRRRARAAGVRPTRRDQRRPSRAVQCGAITAIQRFGSALDLNVHFHTLVLDGVFVEREGHLQFHPLAPPTDAEVARVLRGVVVRIRRVLARLGVLPDEPDALQMDLPGLAVVAAASARRRTTGGAALRRVVDPALARPLDGPAPLCAQLGRFSLHANTAVPPGRRERLEHLCRYVLRPAVATDRIRLTPTGQVRYELKSPWRDGTTHLLLTPFEYLERLVPQVPAPRTHGLRYHGVLAPNAAWRRRVVANAGPPPLHEDTTRRANARGVRRVRLWAELLRRVFAIDALACPACGGRMRLIALIEDGPTAQAMLRCMGLPSAEPRAPPAAGGPAEWPAVEKVA